MNIYPLGAQPVLTGIFTGVDGERGDPTDVTVTVTRPDGTVVVHAEAALANPSVGVWTFSLTADAVGVWSYEFDGSGGLTAEGSASLLVLAEVAEGITCGPWIKPAALACTSDDDALLEWACQLASDTLYLFSGRVYPGVCTDVVRPCAEPVDTNPPPSRISSRSAAFGWGPWSWVPAWGACACGLDGSYGCAPSNQVRLPAEPVVAVTGVRIDGEVLDPSSYRVDAPGWLVRLDGDGWPCCQDLRLDADQPNTFEVAYLFGRPPPSTGPTLAGVLACELVAARSGDTCRLPRRVTQLVRQGTTITFDPSTVFAEGRTGISEIDLWLGSINPHGVREPAKVWTPRSSARAHRVGPPSSGGYGEGY